MAIPAYQNNNPYTISVAGLTNELTIVIPPYKYIAGTSYGSYVGVVPGFIFANADYTDPSVATAVVYVEVPLGLKGYANNTAAVAAGLTVGAQYYNSSTYVVTVVH